MRRDSIYAAKATRRNDSTAAAKAHDDSVAFSALADSMSFIESQLSEAHDDSTTAKLLLQLGRLKERAIDWMFAGDIGAVYAKSHDTEFQYFDPDGRYYYNGRQWRALLSRFPNSGLADSARWQLTHMERGHGD